jgi:hypothetical protein
MKKVLNIIIICLISIALLSVGCMFTFENLIFSQIGLLSAMLALILLFVTARIKLRPKD